jgi:hypothetical protein
MGKIVEVTEAEIDVEFASKLKEWERRAQQMPDLPLREMRADLLLGSKAGNEARLSYRTLSIGGAFSRESTDRAEMRAAAMKVDLEAKAEQLIALTMPLYGNTRRSPAMEDLRTEIKQGFAHWLAESGHTIWASGKDSGKETGPTQAWLAVQAMADNFGDIMQSEEYLQNLANLRNRPSGITG